MLDADNSGTITFEELKLGLKKVGSELMESEILALMNAVRVIHIKGVDSILPLGILSPRQIIGIL